MIEVNCDQRSEEWHKLRLGKITGTRLKRVFQADNMGLIDELIAEIDSEMTESVYENAAMRRGVELEPIARALYCEVRGIEIEEIGFCISERFDFIAYSPDGLTPCRTGGIEIKCPSTKTHVQYIRQNKIPSEYKHQCITPFVVNTKLQWLDFVSFDDRFKSRPLFVKRLKREEIQQELDEIIEPGIEKFQEKILFNYKAITGNE